MQAAIQGDLPALDDLSIWGVRLVAYVAGVFVPASRILAITHWVPMPSTNWYHELPANLFVKSSAQVPRGKSLSDLLRV